MERAPEKPEQEPAHDVLAAEAFAVPAPDPVLHHLDPAVLPGDPAGASEAHDILAAEEFAMPAPALVRPVRGGARGALAGGARARWRTALAALGLLGAVVVRRRRRR